MAKRLTPIKSIRQFCVETCCAGDQEHVRECPGDSDKEGVYCPLWPFRLATNPNISESTRQLKRSLVKEGQFKKKPHVDAEK